MPQFKITLIPKHWLKGTPMERLVTIERIVEAPDVITAVQQLEKDYPEWDHYKAEEV